jgi:hypothetical protein
VQQEKRWSVFRAGLSVEDGEAINLLGAIKSGVRHGTFLSVGLGAAIEMMRALQKPEAIP